MPRNKGHRQPEQTDCNVVVWKPRHDRNIPRSISVPSASTVKPRRRPAHRARKSRAAQLAHGTNKIECNACPARPQAHARDHAANAQGRLIVLHPVVLPVACGYPASLQRAKDLTTTVEFGAASSTQDPVADPARLPVRSLEFGASSTYPGTTSGAVYRRVETRRRRQHETSSPKLFFSYCSFKVSIDTDRFLGEQFNVRRPGRDCRPPATPRTGM